MARPAHRALCALVLAFLTTACAATATRSPVPEEALDDAQPYGIEDQTVRAWGDSVERGDAKALIERWRRIAKRLYGDELASGETLPFRSLVLSGGGPDGAFGAGVLKGWTERGDRPDFNLVTGVSTGAIIAVFAALGPDYDDELQEIYTSYETDQLISPSVFSGLTGGVSFGDASGYRALIEQYIDDEVVAALAAQHRSGHAVLIGTTNLDAARPVIWNISHIAASENPDAKRLIHDVIQASSAIPGVFPPVLIPVRAPDGRVYDELHVDGGATQQLMLFSPSISAKDFDNATGLKFDRSVYVIVNNKLIKPYEPTRPTALSIAGKAVSSLISGAGGGDIYKIFAIAQRDEIELNVLAIPSDFSPVPEEPFDPVYMGKLYELGYEIGKIGEAWLPHPVDYRPAPPES